MNKISKTMSALLAALLFLTSACKTNIARNEDGSFTVDTTITQQELQEAISAAIADPLVQDLQVTLQSGYVSVIGTRHRLNDASKTDALSFRLDLSVRNGQLIASVSDAQIDNTPLDQARVDNWNQTISNQMTKIGQRNENNILQSVSITPEIVTMTWNVIR